MLKYETRNLDLKYPRAVKDDKTRLVLDWLLEFRFSSIELLSKRIGQTAMNANRFFNSLVADGVIQSFKNVHTKNYKFYMLASAGVGYLEAEGRDVNKAVTRVANLGRYSHILHDLCVQSVVMKKIETWNEVVWDKNIDFGDHNDRPDALLKYAKGDKNFWSALEFERWRKDKKRIYVSFMNHVKHIQDRRYVGVTYLFQEKNDCDYYQSLFEEAEWPKYERMKISGKVRKTGEYYIPDEVKNLRKRFVFKHEPVEL